MNNNSGRESIDLTEDWEYIENLGSCHHVDQNEEQRRQNGVRVPWYFFTWLNSFQLLEILISNKNISLTAYNALMII